jgi:hypothetical protein
MRCPKNISLIWKALWLVTRRRRKRRRRRTKIQPLFHGSHFVNKSTCFFVMTIASCFLLEFGDVCSILKLCQSFFNYSSSGEESTTCALRATSKYVYQSREAILCAHLCFKKDTCYDL